MTSFTHTNITIGGYYNYQILSRNYNGLSQISSKFLFNACVAPSDINKPVRIDEGSVKNSLLIAWEAPKSDGGCPVLGFHVYRDDGANSDVTTEVNLVDDPSIVGNPVLRQVKITNWPAASIGIYFRVKVRVYNREGFADSPFLRILNSGYPADLQSPAILVEQSDTKLLVTLPQVSEANNGGSPIISYSLEIDDGKGGDFTVLAGVE